MPDENKAIHLSQVGENWEVEDERATLGQTETQPEAIELAAELATESKAENIRIHTSDGRVEKEFQSILRLTPKKTKHEAASPAALMSQDAFIWSLSAVLLALLLGTL
jgi:hypothetical protein